jgi:hypothetical protein
MAEDELASREQTRAEENFNVGTALRRDYGETLTDK